ncbi:MAG TPA: tRNA dihydrouridine synthase DusB [Nevskiaceae bacterium]|nr:tRNA dihydrouridine synthase DusB [Nevskiaceae bacterium]
MRAMKIGPYPIAPAVVLAPMAGVTDLPFRRLCRQLGAGLAVSEMTTADPTLWHTEKSRLRTDHRDEPEPISVQIAGYDAQMMADAARRNVDAGAQIIDINMGCPAKKVCKRDAGSALMKDEQLVAEICSAVVGAVSVPVTLKIRTGWARAHRNGLAIAQIAQDCGIASLAVHGRTREDLYEGDAEYDTIAAIKQALSIPVLANGDIDSPAKARSVLAHTGADGVMIGRGALGRPWIFREIAHFLSTGHALPPPTVGEVHAILSRHLRELHDFYGDGRGVRVARKHIQWYCQSHPQAATFWSRVNRVEDASTQLALVDEFFGEAAELPEAA